MAGKGGKKPAWKVSKWEKNREGPYQYDTFAGKHRAEPSDRRVAHTLGIPDVDGSMHCTFPFREH